MDNQIIALTIKAKIGDSIVSSQEVELPVTEKTNLSCPKCGDSSKLVPRPEKPANEKIRIEYYNNDKEVTDRIHECPKCYQEVFVPDT